MRIKWYLSDTHAVGAVRGEPVALAINRDHALHNVDCKTEFFLSDVFAADVMIFQRQTAQPMLDRMYRAQDEGVKLIYDIDDDLFNVPAHLGHAYEYFRRLDTRVRLGKFLQTADLVTASTEPLAQALRQRSDTPVMVVPNALDLDLWHPFDRPPKDHISLGWMASPSHLWDVPLVEDALVQLLGEYPTLHVTILGWADTYQALPKLRPYEARVNAGRWQKTRELPEYLSYFDVGLAPLLATEFNRSKSGVKALQYWANGTPVVCSDEPPYTAVIADGVDGLYASPTPHSWYTNLKFLIDNPEIRVRMGQAGRHKLETRYSMRQGAENWISACRKVLHGTCDCGRN